MRKSRGILIGLLILIAVIIVVGLNTNLKITHYVQNDSRIKEEIKIAFVADLHSCDYGENQETLLNEIYKEKPDLIISSGAAVAVPFFYLGKLFGAKLIYIEVFDRIDKPTMTGKLVYPIVDKFIVQWEEMKKVYPKAINLGSIF